MRGLHIRLATAVDQEAGPAEEEEGGLQQQRHPGLPEESISKPSAAEHETDLGRTKDECNTAADKRAMDRLRGLGSVARAHAMNEGTGRGDDLLPSF